ncbi:MAG: aminotransferase class IV [Myxococcota bacterium]
MTLHEDDRGLLYGDALFETVVVRAGRVRWLEHHLTRLERSGAALGFSRARIDQGLEALRGLALRGDGIWRVTVSRDGEGAPFGGTGSVLVRGRPLGTPSRPRMCILRGWYWPEDPLAEHKTSSWLRYAEARRRAVRAGFDDALLATRDGRIGEACAASVFAVVDGRVYTPVAQGILASVTRAQLLAGAPEHGVEVKQCVFTLDMTRRATEIVVVSAGVGALAARALVVDGVERALEDRLARDWSAWMERV